MKSCQLFDKARKDKSKETINQKSADEKFQGGKSSYNTNTHIYSTQAKYFFLSEKFTVENYAALLLYY